jgi:hypothetical protein
MSFSCVTSQRRVRPQKKKHCGGCSTHLRDGFGQKRRHGERLVLTQPEKVRFYLLKTSALMSAVSSISFRAIKTFSPFQKLHTQVNAKLCHEIVPCPKDEVDNTHQGPKQRLWATTMCVSVAAS